MHGGVASSNVLALPLNIKDIGKAIIDFFNNLAN
jgi:hypothetical protein